MSKIIIFTMFDSIAQTWNAMSLDNKCLFYGSINELEAWLKKNRDKYQEQEF